MNKVNKIIKGYKKELKHYENSIYAGICPKCQEKLQLKTLQKENIVTKSNFFFGDKQIKTIINETFVVCPNDHKLIHPKYGERSYPGCIEYNNTLNNEIRNYHNNNYNSYDN